MTAILHAILKKNILNEHRILIQISVKLVLKDPIDSKIPPAIVMDVEVLEIETKLYYYRKRTTWYSTACLIWYNGQLLK